MMMKIKRRWRFFCLKKDFYPFLFILAAQKMGVYKMINIFMQQLFSIKLVLCIKNAKTYLIK